MRQPFHVALGLVLLPLILAACIAGPDVASVEEQAYAIDKRLICPVCPGETIDQSQVELAKQMRALVREKLAQGQTREQILIFFVERYGPGVLAAPPKQGFHLLAWVFPPVILLGAVILLTFVFRAMSRRGPDGAWPLEKATEEELGPYLAQVDTELELLTSSRRGSREQEPKGGQKARPPGPFEGEGPIP